MSAHVVVAVAFEAGRPEFVHFPELLLYDRLNGTRLCNLGFNFNFFFFWLLGLLRLFLPISNRFC